MISSLAVVAWVAIAGAPPPVAKSSAVLMWTHQGHRYPFACVAPGGRSIHTKGCTETTVSFADGGSGQPCLPLADARACSGALRGATSVRLSSGQDRKSHGWDPRAGICPWGDGVHDLPVTGQLAFCSDEEPCEDEADEAPTLAVWPSSAPVHLGAVTPLTAYPERDADLSRIARDAHVDPKKLQLKEAFAVDLDGDGAPERVVAAFTPFEGSHHPEQSPPTWVFVFHGAQAIALTQVGCYPGKLLGAVDLDGDGKLELVMLSLYQLVIYRMDGTVLAQTSECCGLG